MMPTGSANPNRPDSRDGAHFKFGGLHFKLDFEIDLKLTLVGKR